MLYVSIFCIFCRFFCLLTIKIFFPKKISRQYNRAVRSNNSFALVIPMIKLKHYGERSFSYAAPVEWNKLDVEIRSLTNLESFKKKVNTHVFNTAFI